MSASSMPCLPADGRISTGQGWLDGTASVKVGLTSVHRGERVIPPRSDACTSLCPAGTISRSQSSARHDDFVNASRDRETNWASAQSVRVLCGALECVSLGDTLKTDPVAAGEFHATSQHSLL